MIQRAAAILAVALLGASAVARPPQAKKLVDVNVCPITMETVKGKGGGSVVFGNYRVHFCCADCKPAFEKLTKAQKEAKIKQALKKQGSSGSPTSSAEVRVCPMELERVHGNGAASGTYEGHKVYFCCSGCKEAFDKLSAADRHKKLAIALKQQAKQ